MNIIEDYNKEQSNDQQSTMQIFHNLKNKYANFAEQIS